jgi:hypothetical protein
MQTLALSLALIDRLSANHFGLIGRARCATPC